MLRNPKKTTSLAGVVMNRPTSSFLLARLIVKGLFKVLVNLKVDGKENIPRAKRFILIANHLNWSDPFFLYTIMPPSPPIVFVAEYEGIYDEPWKKAFIDYMGRPILPIHRDDPGSRISVLKGMYQTVQAGNILAIFPEGRLGHQEGELFPFHVGVFSVAKKLHVPILPVAIAGTKNLSFRKPIKVRIGELEYCNPKETDENFARRMARTIKDLIPPYPGDGPFPNTLTGLTGLCQGELRPFEGEQDLIVPTSKENRRSGL